MAFAFSVPKLAMHPGDLAGLGRRASAGCARALKEDGRSREEIAGKMSALLDEEVSKWMLDAYSSESRGEHNVPFHRAAALFLITNRFDICDTLLAPLGARVLVGEEMRAARLGHLMAQRAEIDAQIRELRPVTQPIARGRQ